MAKYICFPVVEPPSSGGFDGCIVVIVVVFLIGGGIVAGFNHIFGLDKNNTAQPTQAASQQSQSNSEQNNTQPVHSVEKHFAHHSVHRIREANFEPTHHRWVSSAEASDSSDTSNTNDLHSITNYRTERHNNSQTQASDSSVGDLHSQSDIGDSSSHTNGSNEPSSSGPDLSGGLH